jgi:hypothetical protein
VATIAELGFPLAAVLVNYASFKMGWIAQNTALNMVQLLGMAILLFSVYNLSRVNEQITQKSKLI